MAAEETGRHRLFRRLEQVFGPEEAATFMEHLPPRRWDELATKADVEDLRRWTAERLDADRAWTAERLDADRTWTAERFESQREWTAERFESQREWTAEGFGRLEATIERAKHEVLGTVRGEMNRLVSTQTRTIVFALVAALTANTGLVLTVLRFA